LKVDGPLKLRGRIVIVGVTTHVTQTKGQKPKLQMEDAIVAMNLGGVDQALFEGEKTDGISSGCEGVTKAFQLGSIGWGLCRNRAGKQCQENEDEKAAM